MGGPFPAGVGLLVVGHGTADPVGAAETQAVADAVAELLPGVAVELGFLEVIGPTIGDALERLAGRGCCEVVAAPLLLFAAGHAKRDVPEAIADLRPVPPAETVLLMVGRGSSDPGGVSQLRSFTEASLADEPGGRPRRIELGFVAAARPSLDEAIATACDPMAGEVRRILVQPHLLFRGHVEEQVSKAVCIGRDLRPELEWVQVARLGADRLVARALVIRAVESIGPESLSRQG